jgi:DNA-binding HxlR family transcriptional regulator
MVSASARTHPGDGHTGKEAYTAEGRALCPVMAAISIIGTEWRLAIAHRLLDGPQRFSELLRSNPRLNAKTLSATLKYLENAGVVQRTVVSTRPFSVVYSLTEMGLGLAPATRELRAWGERWVLPRLKGKAAAAAATATGPPAVPPALASPSASRRR